MSKIALPTVLLLTLATPARADLDDPLPTMETVPPGGSSAIAITEPGQNINGFFEDRTIDNINIARGSARVLTNSPKLSCTAMVVEPAGNPPGAMAALHVFKKRAQKGD